MTFYNLIKLAEEQQSSVGENVAKGALTAGVGAGLGLGVGRKAEFLAGHGKRILNAATDDEVVDAIAKELNGDTRRFTSKLGVDDEVDEFLRSIGGNRKGREAARKIIIESADKPGDAKGALERVRKAVRGEYAKRLKDDMPDINKAGYKGALIGAGTGLAAIGAKKLYDRYKNN